LRFVQAVFSVLHIPVEFADPGLRFTPAAHRPARRLSDLIVTALIGGS
jgi:hypothetical protein